MGFGYTGGVTDHTLLTGKEDISGIIDHADLSVISGKLRQSKDVWRTLQSAPYNFTTGCCAVYTGADYIYAFAVDPGTGNTVFLRYTISTNSWDTYASPLSNIGAGAALCYTGGDYIYAFKGGGTTTFWRYRISTNAWAALTNFSYSVNFGGSLVYTHDDYIWGLQGGTGQGFARYSIISNTWTIKANTPSFIANGGALVYPGGDYIYAFPGNNGVKMFRYTTSSDSWIILDSTFNVPYPVLLGGSLVYTYGNYIYAFCGNSTGYFFRLNISTADSGNVSIRWVTMTNAPASISAGGCLVYANENFIYAMVGGNTPDFYRYDGASEQKFGLPFGSHTELAYKEVSGIIDHAALSITSDKLRQSKDVWRTTLANFLYNVTVAGALCYTGGDYIFAVVNRVEMFRYTISTNTWDVRATCPGGPFGAGASLCYDGEDRIYAFIGGNTTGFYYYTISLNTWTAAPAAPATVGAGGALVLTASSFSLPAATPTQYIYAIRGNATTGFWRFNILTAIWEIMSPTIGTISACSLAYAGGSKIYSIGNNAFKIYDIAKDTWDAGPNPGGLGVGCSLVYTGGSYIYALLGNGTAFSRYNVATVASSWTAMAAAPAAVNTGAALCYANENFVYAFRGNNTKTFWRYDGGSEQSLKLMPHGPAHQNKGEDSIQEITALNTKWQRQEWRNFIGSPLLWTDVSVVVGTGAIAAGTAYSSIYTAGNAGSSVAIGLYPLNSPDAHFTEYLNFDKKMVISAVVKILANSANGVATFRIQDGDNHTNVLTTKGFGFRFITIAGIQTLQGMWHDGVNLYTVNLIVNFTLDTWYYLRAEFRTQKVTLVSGAAAVATVDFYVDNVFTNGGAANLPNGLIAHAAELLHTVHNGADAVNNEVVIASSWDTFFYQHPL